MLFKGSNLFAFRVYCGPDKYDVSSQLIKICKVYDKFLKKRIPVIDIDNMRLSRYKTCKNVRF